jgi:UDP-GlcNAc3NAcA epimerase
VLVHTGQHYDDVMSAVFFAELELPRPAHDLGVGGGGHAEMTGRMLVGIEQVLLNERPDAVMVYGDTNSTLAGALAAAKLNLPIAHVEAGLRSHNRRMPEEINRVVTDRLSAWLFCPTQPACDNLRAEGITAGVHLVGDVMYDAARYYGDRARESSTVMQRMSLRPREFVLATCHRAEATGDRALLAEIVRALASIAGDHAVVLPLHPRTRKAIADFGFDSDLGAVRIVEPLPFLDMVALEQQARVILTDSGGVQKEAFIYGVPCVTMRDETEWVETVESGRNQLAGASAARILAAFATALRQPLSPIRDGVYGHGDAGRRIAAALLPGAPVH